MDNKLFGPEWYAFLPYHYCQPSRRVVRRDQVPGSKVYHNDTLECGHVVRRVTGTNEKRRCPECPARPPYLPRNVVIIEDDIVPYVPGDLRKKGWCFINDPDEKVPCVHKTRYLLVHPDFAAEARRIQQEDVESQRESGRKWWRKQKEAQQ